MLIITFIYLLYIVGILSLLYLETTFFLLAVILMYISSNFIQIFNRKNIRQDELQG